MMTSARAPIVGNAAIYTRVSTDKQQDGASLDTQLEACRRYCEANGLVVLEEFRDVLSGLKSDRPQYVQAVAMAKSKAIKKLVVWRMDRLGRDAAEYIPLLRDLGQLGVDVVSATEPSQSEFMQRLTVIMAEEESRRTSIRVMANKQHRAKEGKWGSRPPIGYRNEKAPDGGTVLVPSEQAPLVVELFTRYAGGKETLLSLREFLKEHGVSKSKFAIHYILSNRVYLGTVRHGRYSRSKLAPHPEVTDNVGKHPPLIDEATFEKVQERMRDNRSRRRGGPNAKYLFTSLLFCGKCGHRYAGRTTNKPLNGGRGWAVYICGREQGFGDCGSHSKAESLIREAVLGPIRKLLVRLKESDLRGAVRDELLIRQEAMAASGDVARAQLELRRARVEGRLTRLEDLYLDGTLSKDRYLTRREAFQAEFDEIDQSMATMPKVALPDMDRVFEIADRITPSDMDDQAWRAVIEEVVERIVIEGRDVKVKWKPQWESVLAMPEPEEAE